MSGPRIPDLSSRVETIMRLVHGSPFPEDDRSRQQRRAQELGMAFADLDRVQIAPETQALIPSGISREWRVLAAKKDGATLWVAVDQPNEEAVRRAHEATGLRIIPFFCMPNAMDDALERL